jgi:uncharacterized protein YeaO (DUF488 family)
MAQPAEPTDMVTDFDWVDSSVVHDIDKKFVTTFSQPQGSRLELQRLWQRGVHHSDTSAVSELWSMDISNTAELYESSVSTTQRM